MDRDLVQAAQRGDREAFATLARAHGNHLYAIALRVLRDAGLAEDAVQQALVIAWKEVPALRDPDRFEAWLHRLLVNECYAESRRRRRRLASTGLPLAGDPAAPDEIHGVADRDELERGLRRLPTDQRVLLVLRHYLGLQPAEIAERLAIPGGTVRSRLHAAHRAMRAALEADERSCVAAGRDRPSTDAGLVAPPQLAEALG